MRRIPGIRRRVGLGSFGQWLDLASFGGFAGLGLCGQTMMDANRREVSLIEMRRLTIALVNRDQLAARTASLAHIVAARDTVLNLMAQNKADDDTKSESGCTI